MSNLSYIRTTTLERYVAGDGQLLTDLIIRWASVYLPRCGVQPGDYSINGVSYRADGGSDGFINSPMISDPLGLLGARSVFQFKAGSVTKAEIKAELAKEPADGSKRIRNFIEEGFKVVWFTGRGLTDIQLRQLESDLIGIVKEIHGDAPRPSVIDATRLCSYLTKTPAIAASVVGASGMFILSDAALNDIPHSRFKKFVPGSSFTRLREDIEDFFMNPERLDQIMYIAGEPGIGKSRSVLEAVEQTPSLAGCVCYFRDQSSVKQFINFAIQEKWRGHCIIDEYIGESATTMAITRESVPLGFKIILIGHSHRIDRNSVAVTDEFKALSADEMIAALATTFPGLQGYRIREAIDISKQNLRLARSVCEFMDTHRDLNLDLRGLEKVVDYELDKLERNASRVGTVSGKEALEYLSLVPMLAIEALGDFCALSGHNPRDFKKACFAVSQSSGLIQANDYVLYVGALALGQVALVRLWRNEREQLSRILSNPGQFFDSMLTAIRRLLPCNEKEEMLAFFRLPVGSLSFSDIMNAQSGRHLLQLLTADPDTYLPTIHRLFRENIGRLDQFPYEGVSVGRRELIWKLRELAQFADYFQECEEVVYWLAREEVPSAYGNVASTYWTSWFGAYYDFTTYPYEKRLDLLERRVSDGDALDKSLVLEAIANPFPEASTDIPTEKVGGRLAPPELQFFHHNQITLAADRIPSLLSALMRSGDEAFKQRIGNEIVKASFGWLMNASVESYRRVIEDPNFPQECLQRLIVEVREYVSKRTFAADPPNARVEFLIDQHEKLLSVIDQEDPFLDVLEIAAHVDWGDEVEVERSKQQERVLDRCENDIAFRKLALDVLLDPANHGGGQFGVRMGATLAAYEVEAIIDAARSKGFSQFSYAALRSFLNACPEHVDHFLVKARGFEESDFRTSLAVYQAVGDETYYTEAARAISQGGVSCQALGGFWLRSADDLASYHWPFVQALRKRLESGDADALDVCLAIAGSFARHDIDSDEAKELGFLVLQQGDTKRGGGAFSHWGDIGRWLLKHDPSTVIEVAATKPQSDSSMATHVLAQAVKDHGMVVLNALIPQLSSRRTPPYLFNGSLLAIFANVSPQVLLDWLPLQSNEVIGCVPAHLPKPVLVNDQAIIPDQTRAFWEFCKPDHEAFKSAIDQFSAHTFKTGFYGGYGVDLFSQRVELAKKALHDPSPGLRIWAEGLQITSEAHLKDALRRQSIEKAHREVEE